MIRQQRGFSIVEVLGGLAIISMLALASSAISMQVLRTSKKSKAVSLGMSLESALLESVENQEQQGYRPDVVGIAVKDRLRAGNPPSEIQLWSNFGRTEATMEARTLLYRLKLAPAEPDVLYINSLGQEVQSTGPWVLKLRASYKMMPPAAGALPQYAVAYSISGNENDAAFRSFGTDVGQFQDSHFFYPLAQTIYIGSGSAYATTPPGQCTVEQNLVVSLYSINMQTGATRCVVKGNECTPSQMSNGVVLNVPESGNVTLDLSCVPIQKCSCRDIEPKNWVVTEFRPSSLVGDAGAICGSCEFAFKSSVPAQGVPTEPSTGTIDFPICPSEKYDVTDVLCESEVASAEDIRDLPDRPRILDLERERCLMRPNPTGELETFPGRVGSGPGRAACDRAPDEDGRCWRRVYNVKIVSGTCVLKSEFSGRRPAKSREPRSE